MVELSLSGLRPGHHAQDGHHFPTGTGHPIRAESSLSNLSEAPLERFFQVTKVRVETGAGGSANSEIEIQALKRDDATALRAQLLAARQKLRGELPVASATTSGPRRSM